MLRSNDVIIAWKRRHFDVITSKWRCFDVITTLLLRHLFDDHCLTSPWTNAVLLSIVDSGKHFNEIPTKLHYFSFRKIHMKISSAKHRPFCSSLSVLTHWGRVTHICVGKLTIIGSDNGLSPERRQAIIRTNAGILLIGPLRTNFSEILIGIQTFSFKKMYLKMSSAKRRPFCSSLSVLSITYLAAQK